MGHDALGITGGLEDIQLRVIFLMLALLFLVGLATLFLERLRFPYTIGLVLVGLLLSWLGDWWALPFLPRLHLTENLILYIFLPALIFDAALAMDVRSLVRNLAPILILALPGVVFATLATGALVHWLTPLSLGGALLFGALISTTDPVAVIATFKELKAPERLTMLLDGESLFNDATAIVMFGLIAGMLAAGTSPTAATLAVAAGQFLLVFVGGFIVGCVVGWLAAELIRLVREGQPTLGVLFSICAAYGSFLLAQGYLNLSGVMASVGAGLVVARMLGHGCQARTAQEIHDFWPTASFFGNSLIFLFLGLTEAYLLDQNLLQNAAPYMLVASLVVLAVRALLVYGLVPVSNRLPGQEPISGAYKAVMAWGGLRGALPVGLAVSIRPAMLGLGDKVAARAESKMIILFTLAVVVFTLVIQGVTISRLMKRVGLTGKE